MDPTTRLPHIYEHDVSEQEVEDILGRPLQDIRGRDDSESRSVKLERDGI
jgi:hypothetical protein